MYIGVSWCLLLLASPSLAGKWRWPEGQASASVRIDTKVRFIDADSDNDKDSEKETRQTNTQADEVPFKEPSETEGFYNRPPGAGRYPVRVEAYRAPYLVDGHGIYRVVNTKQKNLISDGTLDSLQYCRCTSEPDCEPSPDTRGACGPGKFLCCYKRPHKLTTQNSEFFNEVEDERPMLLPGREHLARPFPPPPPGSALTGLFGSYGPGNGHNTANIGVFDKPLGVLVGPEGPTGAIGPQQKPNVLVGPQGPTGIIGPAPNRNDGSQSETAQRGVLVGPVGPSGIVGAYGRRPVLVGPGGPTGIIGPARGNRGPNVLVGPGGPTGIIGPGYGRQPGPGLLTGPGGPTGSIGPGRQILVGPSGPSGHIGPQGYFGCKRTKRRKVTKEDPEQPEDKDTTHKHRRNNRDDDELCFCKK